MNIKSYIFTLSLLTFGCGQNLANKKVTVLAPADSKITIENHAMTTVATCSDFTHVATINSSVINGHKLQATSLIKKGNLVFITYNTQFDEVIGGLDVVSLSSTNVPTMVKSLLSENSEYADSKISGNYLYIVGQKKLADLSTKALLTVVDISNTANIQVVSEMQFNGYYATSIDVQSGKAYVSVPNLGTVLVDITNPLVLVNKGTIGSAQTNTLFVKRSGNLTLELGGTATHNLMTLQDNSTATPTWLYSRWLFANQQEAPSRLAVRDNYLYTNGGNSGLTILKDYNTASQTPTYSSSFGTYVAQQGTGNGLVVGSCNKLYQAMGEKGITVTNIANKSAPVLEGTFDYATDSGSANNVFYIKSNGDQLVFVADGLSGVKMVKVGSSCACATADNDIYDDNMANNHDGMLCKIYDLSATQPSSLPDLSTMTSVGSFKMNKADVVNQSSNNSFPYFPTALKTMKTWYAISCEGFLHSTQTETANLVLSSDDGAKLQIDGVTVINNDGLHSASSLSYTMSFVPKDYKIKLEYFQGPATEINLELKKVKGSSSTYLDGLFN